MASVITCIVLEGIMIQEISQRKISILYDLTYMWNLKKNPTKHTHKNLIVTDWQLPETGEGGWLKWVKVVKRQISSYFSYSSPEDIM